eukprot:SAG11_NODE_4380_length_1924_cov_1.736986_2_plen_68_part_00
MVAQIVLQAHVGRGGLLQYGDGFHGRVRAEPQLVRRREEYRRGAPRPIKVIYQSDISVIYLAMLEEV